MSESELTGQIVQCTHRLQHFLESLKDQKSAVHSSLDRMQLMSRAAALLIEIKSLNRAAQAITEDGREAANEAKKKTDQWHLKHQALQYQIHHYNTKIAQCREFKSSEADITLVPFQQFEAEAPPSLQVSPEDRNHQHKLAINRLEFELIQRKRLVAEEAELRKKRKALTDTIEKREQAFQNLNRQLRSVSGVVEPLQSVLGIHTHTRHTLVKRSLLLPTPLYAIFHQLADYKFTRDDSSISVEIEGDVNDAPPNHMTDDAAADADEETTSSHKRKRSEISDKGNGLRVRLTLSFSEDARRGVDGKSVSLCFSHHVMAPSARVPGISGGCLIGVTTDVSAQDLILNLYGPDPLLSQLPQRIQQFNPFAWAQVMAGLVHIPEQQTGAVPVAVYTSDLIKRLRLRAEAKPMLKTQIDFLTKLTIPVPSPSPVFPLTAETKLKEFSEIISTEESDQLTTPSRKFRAVFVHNDVGTVEMEALIEISVEYPLRAPLFTIKFTQHPDKDPLHHVNHLNAIMREVNSQVTSFTPEREENMTLSFQMRHLQMLLDIYVKTEMKSDGEVGSRLSIRNSYGRDRQKPFVFNRQTRMFEERKTDCN
eukprot:c9426_g1_i1.p1 GENE.c9426_g1_i1~~c9426_g1_i1.p1  ORF type:complete len:607 (+),score=158.86 c9426_g1_i1:39-1823(+)